MLPGRFGSKQVKKFDFLRVGMVVLSLLFLVRLGRSCSVYFFLFGLNRTKPTPFFTPFICSSHFHTHENLAEPFPLAAAAALLSPSIRRRLSSPLMTSLASTSPPSQIDPLRPLLSTFLSTSPLVGKLEVIAEHLGEAFDLRLSWR